jgi:hypothetical protein
MGRAGRSSRRRSRSWNPTRLSTAAAVILLAVTSAACGGKRSSLRTDSGAGGGVVGAGGDGDQAGAGGAAGGAGMGDAGEGGSGVAGRWIEPEDGGVACKNLECRQSKCMAGQCIQEACPDGTFTSITGKVYDPAGKLPLYNVNVFVPNRKPDPLVDGPGCDKCGAELVGEPVVQTKTGPDGSFTLGDAGNDVPTGSNVPLVIQVGKWRRELTVPLVRPCMNNAFSDPNLTRLPRNHNEGHLPRIALTTGGADALECLLRKIGIADSEFTLESGSGRVNLFAGTNGTNAFSTPLGGKGFTLVEPWWDDPKNLMQYDIVLHSCDGNEFPSNKSVAARQALKDFADAGGRVFASHWHKYWFERGPEPWPGIATFNYRPDLPSMHPVKIDTSFEKGRAMAEWMDKVGGSSAFGELKIIGGKHTVDAVGSARRWIYSDEPASVQYLEALTPIDAPPEQACGRIVLSDIHVTTGEGGPMSDMSHYSKPFPTGCVTTELSGQEKALVFMLFDLSSCT